MGKQPAQSVALGIAGTEGFDDRAQSVKNQGGRQTQDTEAVTASESQEEVDHAAVLAIDLLSMLSSCQDQPAF
jgi:hypothetical protein